MPTQFPQAKVDDEVVADNIKRILLTRKGERVMRPDSGSNLYDFVFENVDPVMRAGVGHEVRRALTINEPRIEVRDVQVEAQDTEKREVVVTVVYEVNRQLQTVKVTV
jgi:phage baseplate assembly protein W